MSTPDPDTRTRILEATVATLEAAGGQGVRMSDIAKAAGLSRQAVYLHFPNRTELLIAATRHVDARLDVDARLAPSRAAPSGVERLRRFIEAWGHYVPHIHPVARALLAARETDPAAAAAWDDRMEALRDGCRAAVDALHRDERLAPGWTRARATDALWMLLLVPNWEALTGPCGWSVRDYVRQLTRLAESAFVGPQGDGGARQDP